MEIRKSEKESLKEYINNSWDKAVTEKKDGKLKLPFPFVPPCIEGNFRVLYYWDTYFINIGLIIDGKSDLALNNVNDLLFALDYFGCVPNYTRDDGADFCSQPPLLTLMVKDIFEVTGDKKWLEYAVGKIEKEYAFWMNNRITPIGLNQYGTNQKNVDRLAKYYDNQVKPRIGCEGNLNKEEKALRSLDFLAEGESGEDFTPRYDDHNASQYVQIDLNSHLYGVERFLSDYYCGRNEEKRKLYESMHRSRLKRIEKYCFDKETKLYFDYNFKTKRRGNKICSACFLPYFYGFAKDGTGLHTLYEKLFTIGGVVACEDTGEYSYQWGYPNIWAPHQYFAYLSFKNYGLNDIADELAKNFMRLLENEFERTGEIWERYDKDGVAKTLEYDTQPILGWTAGVYNYLWRNTLNK